jgi:hypothetical protein
VGTHLAALRRGIVCAALMAATLVFVSMVVVTVPQGPSGAQLPHGLTSPPTVSASNWQFTPSQDPAVHNGLGARGVSCATSTFCMAVGYYLVGANGYPLIQQWNGSNWTTKTLSVSPQFNFSLDGVSCVSATFCEAVGYTQTSGSSPELPLAMVWNGSSWSTQAVPLPSGQTGGQLSSVSCLSATWCLAVGDSTPAANSQQGQAGSVMWNGSQWTNVATAPNPVGPGISPNLYTYFSSVACTSPSWCLAVGGWEFTDGSFGSGLLEQWNGHAWSQSVAHPAAGQNWLASVSCAGPQFCAAVGYTYTNPTDSTTYRTLTEVWNGAIWNPTPSPNTGGANGDQLTGVSCFAATSCSAVGHYNTDGTGNYQLNEALVWDGTSWSDVNAPNYHYAGEAGPAEGLNGVSCVANWACTAVGGAYNPAGDVSLHMISPIARSGYRFVASDGGIFSYGAPFLGSTGGMALNKPIVGMAVMPAGDGYYLVASDGGIFSYGSAQFYGSMGGKPLNKPIVGMAVTGDGGGYWLVASDGGIFSFGDAQFYGSTGSITLNKPVVGMAATPNGLGYYLVASDGGIFNYGNAAFYGSAGSLVLNKPVVGMAAPVSGGYYLVASDGGIFSYPSTLPFYGSTGSIHLNKPVVGMASVAGGYYLVASDGGIFSYPSTLPFLGSRGGQPLNAPIVGMGA